MFNKRDLALWATPASPDRAQRVRELGRPVVVGEEITISDGEWDWPT